MRTNIVRFFIAILSICVVINLGYQIYIKAFSPYKTEVVYEYNYNHTFKAEGMMFKDEVVIKDIVNSGVIQYLYINGGRVATDSSIARIYQHESDISTLHQIDSINQQIEFLKTAQNTSFESDTSLLILDKQLSNTYIDLIKSSSSGNLSDLSHQKQSIALVLNKRQILTKEVANFNEPIQQLEQQKADLKNSISAEPQEIITQYSGYFVDSIDGLEEQMNLAYSKNITQEELSLLLNQYQETGASNSNLGKIITQPAIIYTALVPTKVISYLKEGETYTLDIEDTSKNVNAEITKIDSNKDNEKSLVSFKITKFTEEIVSLRKCAAEVILGDYSGLKISKSALHTTTDDNTGEAITGVYVVSGITMNFRKVNIVYENNQYVLVENNINESGTLQLYDTIIIKGKDLYDGKSY